MMPFTRFAIYYVPPKGALAEFGAAWLGWDITRGCPADQFDIPGLADISQTPRKYGFHATLKPPFKLARGASQVSLQDACFDAAQNCAPAMCDGLDVAALGRFVALIPSGHQAELSRVADTFVRALDPFRAPLTPEEFAKKDKPNLSQRHKTLLEQWGYPYVMDQFRFHMTLTSRMPKSDVSHWVDIVTSHLPANLSPFKLDGVALCGERPDGTFQEIHRYSLKGRP